MVRVLPLLRNPAADGCDSIEKPARGEEPMIRFMNFLLVLVVSTILALAGCARDSGFIPPPPKEPPPPPLPAPFKIQDLEVLERSVDSALLTWTSPGVPGDTIAATSYDIRLYGEGQSFGSAGLPLDSIPAPRAPGEPDTFLVRGLEPSSIYRCYIRSSNTAGTWSSWSNSGAFQTNLIMETWVKKFGGPDWETAGDMVALAGGDYLIAGTTESHGAGSKDLLLIKVNRSGEIIWQRTHGRGNAESAGRAVATPDGGCVIVGSTSSFGAGYVDVYLLKINSVGDMVWERAIGHAERDDGNCIASDPSGGFMLGGKSWSFEGTNGGYLIRVDAEGEVIWEKGVHGMRNIKSIARAPNGDWILVGDKTTGSGGNITRVRDDGAILWQKTVGDESFAILNAVVATDDGRFFTAGTSAAGGYGALIDGSGGMAWEVSHLEPSMISTAIVDTDGGFIVTGGTHGGYSPHMVTQFTKLGASGEIEWRSTTSIEDSLQDSGRAVIPCSDGGYLVSGRTRAESDGDQDIFLMKMDDKGHIEWTP
jgi:hypothetical protein